LDSKSRTLKAERIRYVVPMYEFLKQIHFGKMAFYEPFSAEELHKIITKITKKRIFVEIERVRQILIELEGHLYKEILLPKDRQQCIAKFSQLFRALLVRRDILNTPENNSEEINEEDSTDSDDSYEELEIII
jgi:hypothetical protein